MKFSVGYQQRQNPDFLEAIVNNREKISEVYFSWGNYANGRNSQLRQLGITPWEAQYCQEADLTFLSHYGIGMNLLFNGMCYGKDSQSRSFFAGIGDTVAYIQERMQLGCVTTTSPLIARFIKENFEGIEVRASVNMCIGTVEGMDYIKDYFDSFYMKRELNRDFSKIRELKDWCDANGKKLYALANSGCLNHCSAHTFHDNLVAHESEIAQMDNGYVFEGLCRGYLKDPQNHFALLDRTGFIRPEDVPHFEGLLSGMKLATRVSPNPVKILESYLNGRHVGSTLDLLEPNHTGLIYPWLLENSRITSCVENDKLIYENLENAMVQLEENLC